MKTVQDTSRIVNPSVASILAEGAKRRAQAEAERGPAPTTPLERAAYWSRHGVEVVYIVQGAEGMPVKIGKAIDVARLIEYAEEAADLSRTTSDHPRSQRRRKSGFKGGYAFSRSVIAGAFSRATRPR